MNSILKSFYATLPLLLVTSIATAPTNFTSDVSSNNTNITGKDCGLAVAAAVAICPTIEIKPALASAECFSADSWVDLIDGRRQKIDELRSGNALLAFDGFRLVTTQMIMMLDTNKYKEATFYTLQTESNHTISLTAFHLIPIVSNQGTPQYLPAKDVTLGNDLYVLSHNGQLVRSPIIRITIQIKIGYYAPVTVAGTLMVNNVLASCFAHVHSHQLAQLSMTPLHLYHRLSQVFSFIKQLDEDTYEGIHWMVEPMLNFAQQFYPSLLQLY